MSTTISCCTKRCTRIVGKQCSTRFGFNQSRCSRLTVTYPGKPHRLHHVVRPQPGCKHHKAEHIKNAWCRVVSQYHPRPQCDWVFRQFGKPITPYTRKFCWQNMPRSHASIPSALILIRWTGQQQAVPRVGQGPLSGLQQSVMSPPVCLSNGRAVRNT